MTLRDDVARAIYDVARTDAMEEADWDELNKRFFGRQADAALRAIGIPVETLEGVRAETLVAVDSDEWFRLTLADP